MIYRLSEESIISHVDTSEIVEQGKMIVKTKGVVSLKRSEDSIVGIVRSSREAFRVSILFDHHNMVKKSICNCRVGTKGLPCRHVAAVLLSLVFNIPEALIESGNYGFILNYFNEVDTENIENAESIDIESELIRYPFDELLEDVSKYEISKKAIKLGINIVVDKVLRGKIEAMIWTIDFKIGEDRLYVVKSLPMLVEAVVNNHHMDFGQRFTYSPREHYLIKDQQKLVRFLKELQGVYHKTEAGQTFYSTYESFINGKHLVLDNDFLIKQFIHALGSLSFDIEVFYDEWGRKVTVEFIKEGLKIPINISEQTDNENIIVELKAIHSVIALTSDYEYVMYEEQVFKLNNEERSLMSGIKSMNQKHGDSLNVTTGNKTHFFTKVYPKLSHIAEIRVPSTYKERLISMPLTTKVYFEKTTKGGTLAKIHFIYGDQLFFASQNRAEERGVYVLRDGAKENEVLNLFTGFESRQDGLYLEGDQQMYDFANNQLVVLRRLADVYYEKGMMPFKHSFSTFRQSVGIAMDDYLEVHFEGLEYSSKELGKIYSAIKEKKSYVRLKDGSFLDVQEEKVQEYFELLEELDISVKDIEDNQVKIPLNRAFAFEKLSSEREYEVLRDASYESFLYRFEHMEETSHVLGEQYKSIMRDYQKVGFHWLSQLYKFKLGGILADDMGLGKTLQAIAFLDAIHTEDKRPSLIIAPTSLVYNWEAEIRKFAPHIQAIVITGTKQERLKQLERASEFTLVITSYALVRIDLEQYKAMNFATCIIDEAQNIKNPKAKTSRAVKRIQAGGYLALTGTPIENNLTELWSIFDFVMPGYLRSHSKFFERFEKPISYGDEEALKNLRFYIEPFIMRRMKQDVLTELPPKIETKAVVHMTKEQQKLYMAYLDKAKQSMEEDLKNEGYGKSKFKIFSYLTRLRQICCHPETFVEDYHGGSGKLDMLRELLFDGIEAGHKVLVFSQFTSMLKIIKDMLNEDKISYEYLDGSTKAKDRQMLVNRFNDGGASVFLISLKAGGTGLNLTGADIVIHFDPWWNPAVEEQATDRAYRIGQTSSVQVFKMITEGTIEDKIYQLQERKREMIASVIKPGETMLEKLSENDLRDLFE